MPCPLRGSVRPSSIAHPTPRPTGRPAGAPSAAAPTLLRMAATDLPVPVQLPSSPHSSPLRPFGIRLAVAIGLIVFVALLCYLGRDGYTDPEDESISLLDAFYY